MLILNLWDLNLDLRSDGPINTVNSVFIILTNINYTSLNPPVYDFMLNKIRYFCTK